MRARFAVPLGMLLAVAAVALVCPGSGQEDPATEPAQAVVAPASRVDDSEPSDTSIPALSLSGRVLDPQGRPVAGAQVSLVAAAEDRVLQETCGHCGEPLHRCSQAPTFERVSQAWDAEAVKVLHQTTTGSDGRFSFRELRRVSYAVVAQADGFGAAVRERAAPGEAVEVTLAVARRLEGSVIDGEGHPLAGAMVRARSRVPLRFEAVTGRHGAFSLPVGDGPFYVVADAPGFIAAGKDEVVAGSAVQLMLERERRLEIAVTRHGRAADATVHLSGEHVLEQRAAKGGFLSLPALPPGEYTVYAEAGPLASPTQLVKLTAPSARVDLELGEGGTLELTIVDGAGQPVPNPHVTLEAQERLLVDLHPGTGERTVVGPVPVGAYTLLVEADGYAEKELQVTLAAGERQLDVVMETGSVVSGRVVDEYGRPAEGVVVNVSPTGDTATSGSGGRFSVTLPMPGVYTLEAHHSDWGGATAKISAPADGVELELQARGGVIAHVTTTDGAPVEGATLSLRGREDLFFSDRPSGADGTAVMHGLPSGEYLVRAAHPDRLPSNLSRLKVEEGKTVEVTLTLAPGARIRGRVHDEQGRPVAGALVVATPHSAEATNTDAEGRFSLGPLRPDSTFRVEIEHPEYDEPPTIAARPGGAELDIALHAKARFSGRVVERGGGPVTHFWIDKQEFTSASGRFEAAIGELEETVTFSVMAPGYRTESFSLPATEDLGTLELSPTEFITGVVLDPSGSAVADAEVNCDGCENGVLSGADGRFSLPTGGEGEVPLIARKGSLAGHGLGTPGRSATVRLQQAASTRLRVFGPDGAPAPGEAVDAIDTDLATAKTFVTGADGTATVTLPAAGYRLGLRSSDVTVILRVDARTTDVVLGPGPGTGTLSVQLPNVYGLSTWVIPGRVDHVSDPPTELTDVPLGYQAQHPRGVAVFEGLAPGPYTVVVANPYVPTEGGPKVSYVTVAPGPNVLAVQ